LKSLTQHHGVDDEADDVLHDEDRDGGRTVFRYHPSPEADGHLDLDGEEEGRDEGPGGGGRGGSEVIRNQIITTLIKENIQGSFLIFYDFNLVDLENIHVL